MSAFEEKSESICAIAKAITEAFGELQDVAKTQTAKAGAYSYSYATIADALGMARPILSKHGLALMQTAETTAEDVIVHTTIMHSSGEFITHQPTRLASGADAQKTGSAITYARRYSLMAALGLATEDDDGATAPKRQEMPKAQSKPPLAPAKASGFRTADKIDGLTYDERNALLVAVSKARQTNDNTKEYVKGALDNANVELLSDLSDNDLEKLRRALNDIIMATVVD